LKLLVRRIDLSNRPSTRSFTRSRSRHAVHPLTGPNVRLAKAQFARMQAVQEQISGSTRARLHRITHQSSVE
jgi:hypothetical protein